MLFIIDLLLGFPGGSDGKESACNAENPGSLWCSVCMLSRVQLFATPWTAAHQAPLSMGFFRQDWSWLPFPPAGGLPDTGIEP